jgi:hypothetical protein
MVALLREHKIDTERVINLDLAVLIASKSAAGAWHAIEGGRCDRAGFRYRHTYRHLALAQLAAELDRCQSVAVEAVTLNEPGELGAVGQSRLTARQRPKPPGITSRRLRHPERHVARGEAHSRTTSRL